MKCFYEIVARLDTDATCTTGTPSGRHRHAGADPLRLRALFDQRQRRQAAADRAISPTAGTIRSREAEWTRRAALPAPGCRPSQTSQSSNNGSTQPGIVASCNNDAMPATATITTRPAILHQRQQHARRQDDHHTSPVGRLLIGGTATTPQTRHDDETYQTSTSATRRRSTAGITSQIAVDVSGAEERHDLERHASTWPIGANGTDQTITWDGCIEERPTVTQPTSYDPDPARRLRSRHRSGADAGRREHAVGAGAAAS